MPDSRLLLDIGGTNARLALQLQPEGPLLHQQIVPCADFPGVRELIAHYLQQTAQPGLEAPKECAMGIASPILGDQVVMTNNAWQFSRSALQAHMGWRRLLVLNDFTALAMALPVLLPGERRQLGVGEAVPGGALALIGPGTGLGVGGLLPAPGGGYSAIAGEGGHVTLAGTDEWEDAVVSALRADFGHASAERALSGPGLLNLYRACCTVARQTAEALDPPEISRRALAGSDARCVQTVDLFYKLLGSVAGNLALTLGAQGGVYVGGGIVPAMGTLIERSQFRARFEAKGRYAGYLRQIPTFVIETSDPPALRGAAQALNMPA